MASSNQINFKAGQLCYPHLFSHMNTYIFTKPLLRRRKLKYLSLRSEVPLSDWSLDSEEEAIPRGLEAPRLGTFEALLPVFRIFHKCKIRYPLKKKDKIKIKT